MGTQIKQCIFLMSTLLAAASPAIADPLVYRGDTRQQAYADAQQVTGPGNVALMPVTYSTNYEAQQHPYSSFMGSPYIQAGYSASYGDAAYGGQAPYGSQQLPGGMPQVDPFAANEKSPYSRYSPYLEIVGEGSDYDLGIDDVVTIIVRNQPDFSGRFVVDPSGNIQYNFVGDIKAEGKTKEQLKADIAERLREYVRYPEVAVMISEYRSKNVYVFGFVNRPGKFAMKGNSISVKEAMVAAGLPRMDGSLKRVYVIRPSEHMVEGTAGGKKVDLHKLINKGDSAQDFILQPGDTLVVHQKYFDKFVNAFSRLVGPVFQAAAVYELAWGGDANGFLNPND